MFKATIKVETPQIMVNNTTVHVAVYSDKSLPEGKAIKAAQDTLRAHGFMVYNLAYDRSSDRSAMVSALIR